MWLKKIALYIRFSRSDQFAKFSFSFKMVHFVEASFCSDQQLKRFPVA